MVGFIISYTSTLLEFICIYIISHCFLSKSLKPTPTDIFACGLATVLLGTIPDEYSTVLWILGQLVYVIYTMIISDKMIFRGMVLYTLSTCVLMLTQFAVVIVIALINMDNNNILSLIGNVFTLAIILPAFLFTPIKHLYTIVINSSKLLQMLLINTYLILFYVLLSFKTDQLKIYNNPAALFLVITLLIFINAGILYYDLQLQNQEQKLELYRKNLPIYESLINDIRSSQHEYSNRLQALSNLPVVCRDYESLSSALLEHTKEYSHTLHAYSLLQTNMPLLSASLYNLMNRAAADNITVHFNVVSTILDSIVPEYILADMTCILLQNAIEECRENDFIYVNMESSGGRLHFEVRNPSRIHYSHEELLNFFQKGVSTKNPHTNQGLGLYYLKSTIDKYNGAIGCECINFENELWVVFKFQV